MQRVAVRVASGSKMLKLKHGQLRLVMGRPGRAGRALVRCAPPVAETIPETGTRFS
jgi:hypothetical protein